MKIPPYLHEFLKSLWRKNRTTPAQEGPLDRFQEIIGYRFTSEPLLRQVLTHKSSVNTDDGKGLQSNERLEFLGDAVLNCLVTEHLYHRFPERHEGQLSKIKSLVVSRKILGEIARTFDAGRYLVFGISEEKTGGRDRLSILANVFEAILGGIFLDGGYEPSKRFLVQFLFCRLDDIVKDERNVNHKSVILEFAQREGLGMPRYVTLSAIGPDHAKEFRVRIEIAGVPLGEGSGPNKKIAQQNAAQSALANYRKDGLVSYIKGAKKDELVSH
ncbi:MAG: ribonuclease III [Chitinispirillaceae bacterium]|nr:ribonuclease III [Chitinispirillaceae bacterium]